MNSIKISLLCLGLIFLSFSAKAANDPDREYAAYVQQSRSMPAHYDFDRARLLYTQTSTYHPQTLFPTRDFAQFIDRAQKKDASVATEVEHYTTINFALPEGHTRAMVIYQALHVDAMARYHEWAAKGLMAALLHSGDGKSEITAYRVVVVSEEYLIAHQVLQHSSQHLVKDQGRFYDVLSGPLKDSGKTANLWFDATPMFIAAAR